MRFYSVDPPPFLPKSIVFDGSRKWMLPGLDCPKCGIWISVGRQFPCIVPRADQKRYFIDGPMPLEWFKKVLPASGIRRPDGALPGPAEEFGPFSGKARSGSVMTDFVRPVPWMIFVRETVMNAFLASGLQFGGFAKVEIKGSKKLREPLFEIQITDGLLLDESCVKRSGRDCELCGRNPVSLKEGPLKLRGKTSRVQHDIFRAANFATKIFATEKFKSVCEANQFTNIRFTEVKYSARDS